MIRITLVNLLFFILMIAVNYSSATNVGITANQEPALIQPAGYAFSIWGLIYVLVLLWILRAPFQRREKGDIYRDTQVWIPINFLLNSAWIVAFTMEWILVSTLVIVLLLISLIRIYQIIYWKHKRTGFARLPFSIYIGWVSAATVVNIFTWFVWNDIVPFLGMGEVAWTVLMLLILAAVAVVFTRVNRDVWYSLVFIWVYAAVFVKNEQNLIVLTTVIGILILAVHLVMQIMSRRKAKKKRGMSSWNTRR
ncbi:tryptophan-rich sensory protein [Salibacterium lacus]|uniref:Tryptophan-rich sensory protein n=1 Tax=Salibacterium lacus TaxID=1898109 RepID=A0ABW5T0M9_9BACI